MANVAPSYPKCFAQLLFISFSFYSLSAGLVLPVLALVLACFPYHFWPQTDGTAYLLRSDVPPHGIIFI